MKYKLSILQKCTLFHNKSIEEIEALLSEINYKIESFDENDIIFSPVQNADKIGILLSGSVDVQKIFPNGKMIIIERKKACEVIGECVFSKYSFYPDSVCSCKETKILYISKKDLIKLFTIDKQFMLNFLILTSNSMLMLKYKIGLLSLDSIQEKIAGYLIHCLQYENEPNNKNTVLLPFSKKAWAEYMDISRTSLSRELRNLEVAGILSFRNRTIKIMDIDRLSKIISL